MKQLILAPHPDDELVGTGGLLLQSRKSSHEVRIVYITQGRTKEESQRKADLRKYAVQEVLKEIGFKDQVFLEFFEQELLEPKKAKECQKKVLEQIQSFKPDEVYVTAFEGGNIDHDITNFLTSRAIKQTKFNGVIFEYAVYNNYPTLRKFIEIVWREIIKKTTNMMYWDKTEFIPVKDSYIVKPTFSKQEIIEKNANFYKYQLFAEKALDGKKPRKLLRPYGPEQYRELPKHNYLKKPHGILPLNYTLAWKIPFEKFQKLVRELS